MCRGLQNWHPEIYSVVFFFGVEGEEDYSRPEDSVYYNARPINDLLNKCDKACSCVEKIMYNGKCSADEGNFSPCLLKSQVQFQRLVSGVTQKIKVKLS